MKKKVSVELWRRYKHYIITIELALEKLGMEIVQSRREIGSIFGLLSEEHFEKVEDWKEVMGIFEVDKLPGEAPSIKSLSDLKLSDLNLSGKEPAETN